MSARTLEETLFKRIPLNNIYSIAVYVDRFEYLQENFEYLYLIVYQFDDDEDIFEWDNVNHVLSLKLRVLPHSICVGTITDFTDLSLLRLCNKKN